MNSWPWRKAGVMFITTTIFTFGVNAATPAELEEIVVTAERRESSLHETPIAMAALSSETIVNRGITDLTGIATAAPSVTAKPYSSSSNMMIMSMRGQGSANPMEITQDGAVGLYVDGIYISRPQATTFDIADVERVEVLRGPQGTLYGRNTTGGAVNIISRKPSGELAFRQDFTIGSYDQFRSLSTIDLPEYADLSLKLSYLHSEKDGYVKNMGSGNDFNNASQNAIRTALRWKPRTDFTADYSFEKGEMQSTPVYFQSPSLNGLPLGPGGTPYVATSHRMNRSYRPADLPESDANYTAHTMTLEWQPTADVTFRSLSGYRNLDTFIYQDYMEIFYVPFTTADTIRSKQVSQEIQALGTLLEGQLNYIIGLFWFKEEGGHREIIAVDMDRYVKAKSESRAVFGQTTWIPPILDGRLDITLGLRYTNDKREAQREFEYLGYPLAQLETTNSNSYSKINPSLNIAYRWTPDLFSYVKAATGYRAGGSSEAAGIDNFGVTFGAEKVTSYEVGLKSYLFDRRASLNIAAFMSKLDDMQIAFTADSANPSFTQAYNAGEARIDGIEAELVLKPLETMTLAFDYTYLTTKIKRVDVLPGTIFSESISPYKDANNIAALFNVPYAPRHSFNLSVDYTFLRFAAAELGAYANYRWSDSYYDTTTSGRAVPNGDMWKAKRQGLLDARLNLDVKLSRGEEVRVSFWAKNLLDQDYHRFNISLGSPLFGYDNHAYAFNEPRTYGIDTSYRF